MSQQQNRFVALAVLGTALEVWAGFDFPEGVTRLPRSVRDDLWEIVSCEPRTARLAFNRLGTRRHATDVEDDLRLRIVGSAEFMALAWDLANNFIALSSVPIRTGERVILGYSYDEEVRVIPIESRIRKLGLSLLARPKVPGAGRHVEVGAGRVSVVAQGVEQRTLPEPSIEIEARVLDGNDHEVLPWFSLGRSDCADFDVPDGRYVLEYRVGPASRASRHAYLPVSPVLNPFDVTADATAKRPLVIALSLASVLRQPREPNPPASRWDWFLQAVGIDAKRFELDAPAVSTAASYHLEFVVPRGLVAESSMLSLASGHDASERAAQQHRVHHRVTSTRSGDTGLFHVLLRPRTSTILRSGFAVAVLLLGLQVAVILLWRHLHIEGIGTVATIVTAVPAGLSAYVARSHDDAYTSHSLAGLRTVALSVAVWATITALLISLAAPIGAADQRSSAATEPARGTAALSGSSSPLTGGLTAPFAPSPQLPAPAERSVLATAGSPLAPRGLQYALLFPAVLNLLTLGILGWGLSRSAKSLRRTPVVDTSGPP